MFRYEPALQQKWGWIPIRPTAVAITNQRPSEWGSDPTSADHTNITPKETT